MADRERLLELMRRLVAEEALDAKLDAEQGAEAERHLAAEKDIAERRRVSRADAARLKAEIDAILDGAGERALVGTAQRPGAGRGVIGMDQRPGAGKGTISSIPARVVQILDDNPDMTFDAQTIARTLGAGVDITSLRSSLARLTNENRIRRAGHGRYQALPVPGTESGAAPEAEVPH